MSSDILTQDLVKEALEIIIPRIESFMTEGHTKRTDLAIIVANRTLGKRDLADYKDCLAVARLGDVADWEYPFDRIALSKAAISMRSGVDSVKAGPQYRYAGDTVYWGSVVLDGIVVACSGVEPYFDEMFSIWVAGTIRALCKKKFDEISQKSDFI